MSCIDQLKYLRCPLTNLFFYDPVISDGIIYERMAIQYYLTQKGIKQDLVSVPLIKSMVDELSDDLKKEQFLKKKPYFLFKNEFINDLKNKNFDNLLCYVEIIITDNFNDKINIGLELLTSCCPNIIKGVINNCIDYDMFSADKTKLIHIASICSTPEIIRFLAEEKNVNMEEDDGDNNYPAHYIAKYFNDISSIKHLINTTLVNKKGFSVAHMLCKHLTTMEKYEDMISIVKNLEESSKEGLNCFHYACLYTKDPIIIKKFFHLPINIEKVTENNCNIHDLIYKNRFLTKEQKMDLIFDYLIIVKDNNREILENYII